MKGEKKQFQVSQDETVDLWRVVCNVTSARSQNHPEKTKHNNKQVMSMEHEKPPQNHPEKTKHNDKQVMSMEHEKPAQNHPE